MQPLLRVDELKKTYPLKAGLWGGHAGEVQALRGVSFDLHANQTLGLVGESGCGKSTMARLLMGLEDADSGRIIWEGREVEVRDKKLKREMQIIFQDPFGSLNPRQRIIGAVQEPLRIHGLEAKERASDLLQKVGIAPNMFERYPHEFSGGQRQRICIARALALNPRLLICDEPVSALDVSIQAQVINLLADLQDEFELACIFISHDLSVVGYLSHRVAVMYRGRIVELAATRDLFGEPLHPYTVCLMDAIPEIEPGRPVRSRPGNGRSGGGCSFAGRCERSQAQCLAAEPRLREIKPGHFAACHLA